MPILPTPAPTNTGIQAVREQYRTQLGIELNEEEARQILVDAISFIVMQIQDELCHLQSKKSGE